MLSTAAFDYRGDVLRVATDAGQEATMSPNHLVITPDGPRQARELEAGAQVRVEDGTAQVAEISPEPYDGKLWNLSLSGPDDKPDPGVNSVYAGGLMVGDYELQETYDHAWRTDPDRVRALLGPDYEIDYSNYLDEIAARAEGRGRAGVGHSEHHRRPVRRRVDRDRAMDAGHRRAQLRRRRP